jgi:hypothetical protein
MTVKHVCKPNYLPLAFSPLQAPLSNVQRMKFTKGGAPFVLDFLPKVRLGSQCRLTSPMVYMVVLANKLVLGEIPHRGFDDILVFMTHSVLYESLLIPLSQRT